MVNIEKSITIFKIPLKEYPHGVRDTGEKGKFYIMRYLQAHGVVLVGYLYDDTSKFFTKKLIMLLSLINDGCGYVLG